MTPRGRGHEGFQTQIAKPSTCSPGGRVQDVDLEKRGSVCLLRAQNFFSFPSLSPELLCEFSRHPRATCLWL